MKLRTKYVLFVVIIHLVTLVLSFTIFRDNKLFFIASEILILISIIISWQLYKELLQPLQTLMRGLEAIKERDFNIKFVTTGKYEMDQLISVYNQMMEQLKLERTKQEEQHFFLSKLINTSPTGILVLDYDGYIHQLNPKAAELLGVEEKDVTGKLPADLSPAIMQEIKRLTSGESKTVVLNGITTYKLQKSHFIDRGFPRYFIMIEELTAEILAAEKKAYGKVIRMMAHEVNNTIGPVNSIIESALHRSHLWDQQENKPLQEALQVAMDRNQNLNLFMRNFADVVRLPEPNKKKTDLHELINHVTTLLKTKAEERGIIFEYFLSEDPVYFFADEQQMAQVLINIVKNALEAIDEKGVVSFTTTLHPKKIIITDTGTGIGEQQSDEIFTPFFSTKKTGQGIGLTVIKEILLNHHFSFSLKTAEPGKTEFEIVLN
jgi:two-component system, NtrC family, nitrogen regulation sensor histidine kinase NtrY